MDKSSAETQRYEQAVWLKVHKMTPTCSFWREIDRLVAVLVNVPDRSLVCLFFPKKISKKTTQMTFLTLTFSNKYSKAFFSFQQESLMSLFSADFETAFVAHHVPITPLVKYQWNHPNSCVGILAFQCRYLARLLLAHHLPFIYLIYWFIPWHSELCNELHQLCSLNCFFSSPFHYICWCMCYTSFCRVFASCLCLLEP